MPDIANAGGTPNPGDDGQVDIGDTGTYECDENFAPSGNGEINCTNVEGVGEWSETDFSCTGEHLSFSCFFFFEWNLGMVFATYVLF